MKVRREILAAVVFCAVGARAAVAAPTLTTLATFNNSNGAYPRSGLIADAAGDLYGTTSGDGFSTYGTVFRVPAGGGSVTTLATFDNSNGAGPQAGLIADAAGNLYGTTGGGGEGGFGTVFRVAVGGGSVTTLATFDYYTSGAYPYGGLIADAAGNLYGTTFSGGASGYGTVFKVSDAGFVVPEPGSLGLCVPVLAMLTRWRR